MITISACSPTERSWEIEALQQGVFTYALLEALQLGGDRNCATVERLSQYLRFRIPDLCRYYGKVPTQTPRISTDPTEKLHFILLPQYATLADIALLKNDAYRLAFLEKNPHLAQQLCIRAIAAAMGRDMELLKLYTQIQRMLDESLPLVIPPVVDSEGGRSGGGEKPASSSVLRESEEKSFSVDLGNGVQLEMVAIPGGTFWMGAPDGEGSDVERPCHQVTVAHFWMGKFVVTQAQYEAVVGSNPSHFKGANRPVEQVSWHDVLEFCLRLSAKASRNFWFPSEAEWEYACRAGTTTPFYFGETISTNEANYDGIYTYGSGKKGEFRQKTTDVGSFLPNAFGIYDVHGNVFEWCLDHWHSSYEGAPTDGSAWIDKDAKENATRVIRGGSWSYTPVSCRSAYRSYFNPRDTSKNLGFRVVCSSPKTLGWSLQDIRDFIHLRDLSLGS